MNSKSKVTLKTDPNAYDHIFNVIVQKNMKDSMAKSPRDSLRNNLRKQTRLLQTPAKQKQQKHGQLLPPRAVPFRRNNQNVSRNDSRIYSEHKKLPTELKNYYMELEEKARNIQHKLGLQTKEKERLHQLNTANQAKIKKLSEDVSRLTMDKVRLQELRTTQQFRVDQGQAQLKGAWLTIESLNKTIQQLKSSQVYANVKSLQTQVNSLTQKNGRLSKQYQQITKLNRQYQQYAKINKLLKQELQSKKQSTEQSSEITYQNKQGKNMNDFEIIRLRGELAKTRSERQKQLEFSLQVLQKKLYEKQAQIKKMSIQLNFVDRKRFASIDEVRQKKDKEIKQLKTSLIKTAKDLKQAKETIELNEKKSAKKLIPCPLRKVKSNKNIGFNSESQVTFELSSNH